MSKYIFFKSSLDFDFCFFLNGSTMYIKEKMGILYFTLPSMYFYKYSLNNLSLAFVKKEQFISFYRHFLYKYKRLCDLYFMKLKLKGMGYRLRKITNFLYRFYFNATNFFYFHVPSNVLVKTKKRKMILLSNDLALLKNVFANLLLLKRFTVYRVRGIVYPRQIIMLRTGKKNL